MDENIEDIERNFECFVVEDDYVFPEEEFEVVSEEERNTSVAKLCILYLSKE
jgi:hypothetical protein